MFGVTEGVEMAKAGDSLTILFLGERTLKQTGTQNEKRDKIRGRAGQK